MKTGFLQHITTCVMNRIHASQVDLMSQTSCYEVVNYTHRPYSYMKASNAVQKSMYKTCEISM